jgi:ABC-type glutathione transport system ATPase component
MTNGRVAGIADLHLQSPQPGSSTTPGSRDRSSPSPSPGPANPKERHQVESEDPPENFAHMTEVQDALDNARTLSRTMASVLSSSNLHHENGSSIQKLHQQATRLIDYQLPSSRIVGLVGDSGVGKSSLINSLLDKKGLARDVSGLEERIMYIFKLTRE